MSKYHCVQNISLLVHFLERYYILDCIHDENIVNVLVFLHLGLFKHMKADEYSCSFVLIYYTHTHMNIEV